MLNRFIDGIIIKYRAIINNVVAKDCFVLFVFLFLFLLLNWRLFAFGSINQLFLYGDNLPILNNLLYIFNNFNFLHPFDTVIGQNGMLGSYPMAEPQNSIFYPPIAFLLVVYKLFHLQVVGLYYELLFLHTAHFLLGVFFIFKICQKILGFSRTESFFAGLVYLGFGWNAAWFGTGILSYMIGILPLTVYVFLMYLKKMNVRWYALFVLSISLFLYAGGLVNFFFYLLLNLFTLFSALILFKYEDFPVCLSKKDCIVQYGLIFLLAPILGLLAYSAQLYLSYSVSADISHASSSYDYLAFFGLHFYDLIGTFFPKFALVQFGWVSNPQIIIEFLIANNVYVGFVTIAMMFLGAFLVKNKLFTLFFLVSLLNLLLAFGGSFALYDATYFFPGNNLFRGHYKYIMFVGVYVALMMPFILRIFRKDECNPCVYKKIQKYVGAYLFFVFVFAVIFGIAAFSFKFLQKIDGTFPVSYSVIALTLANYFFRMLLIGGISWIAIRIFIVQKNDLAVMLLALVLVMDISVNFKYNMYYGTDIHDFADKTFFKCCQDKTIVSDIDKYTQAYHAPEVSGIDLFIYYSAIPNRYIVDYNNHLKTSSGEFNSDIMRAAGIDGVLTTSLINDENFTLVSSKKITRENYNRIFSYNFDGDIHNDWGSDLKLIGQTVYYYSLRESKKVYFTTEYSEKLNEENFWENVNDGNFSVTEPVLLVDKKEKKYSHNKEYIDASFIVNTPTYKKIALNNISENGLLYINIPYSSIWKARVNGIDSLVYRSNGAFSGVKVNDRNAVIELYVEKSLYSVFVGVSVITIFLIVGFFLTPENFFKKILSKYRSLFGKSRMTL